MNNELKKDLILGMCFAMATHFKNNFNDAQTELYKDICEMINEIYYSKKDLSKPTPRNCD